MNYWENNDPNSQVSAQTQTTGLSEFFTKTYTWMALGLGLTGLLAVLISRNVSIMYYLASNPMLYFGLFIGELVLVIAFTRMAMKSSTNFSTLLAMFVAYAALNGVTLSVIFLAYTAESIASTFFITAASFGALSVYGMVTKKDLTGMGRFLFIALIGIIIASVVNFFLNSSGMAMAISIFGVLIFAGLTAYDTQVLKIMYFQNQHDEAGLQKIALRGALKLYLDFINLMLFLLRLLGNRR